MRRGPGSTIKEEFEIDQSYPRRLTDGAVSKILEQIEASLEAEVGSSLYAD